jgi:hypothetical protein
MKSTLPLMFATVIVAAAGAVTTPALADGYHTEQLNAQFAPSTRTRAEVRAEALAAARKRTLARFGDPASSSTSASTRTSLDVAAEAQEAARASAHSTARR